MAEKKFAPEKNSFKQNLFIVIYMQKRESNFKAKSEIKLRTKERKK